jgi:molybdopterin-containing oxidoreductase family membrane subunit
MWSSVLLCFGGLGLFAYMKIRKTGTDLMIGIGCIMIFVALWLDKGLGFVMGGLVVSPLEEITEYYPTANEIGITLGIWATGFLLVTLLYKIAVGVEHEIEA